VGHPGAVRRSVWLWGVIALVVVSGAAAGVAPGIAHSIPPPSRTLGPRAGGPLAAGPSSLIPPGRPVPLAGSSAADRFLSNWTVATGLVSDPSDTDQLLALSSNLQYSFSGDPAGSGAAVLERSVDGGSSWAPEVVPPGPNWSMASSHECGQRFTGEGALGFAPNGTAFFAGVTTLAASDPTCVVPQWAGSIYLSESAPGSSSWSDPIPVSPQGIGTRAFDPAIAVDPTGGAVLVAFVVAGFGTTEVELTNVTSTGPAPPVVIAVQTATSLSIATTAAAPGYVDLLWDSAGSLRTTWSTDGGTVFSPPTDLADGLVPPSTIPASIAGDPSTLAIDASSRIVYVAWANQTSGSPAAGRIMIDSAPIESATWGSPVVVASAPNGAVFAPAVAVVPNATLAVSWLDENLTTDQYAPIATFVPTPLGVGGEAPAFVLSSSTSPVGFTWNGTPYVTPWVGNRTELTPAVTGVIGEWTDLRSADAMACPGCSSDPVRNASVFATHFLPIRLSTNLPSVTVRVSGALAGNGSVPLSNGSVSLLGAPQGGAFSASAPSEVTVGAAPWYFAAWIGTAISPNSTLKGNWTTAENFTACYTSTQGGACQLPGAPGVFQLTVVPSFANGTIGTLPFGLVNGTYSVLLPPGYYPLTVEAPGYLPLSEVVTIVSGQVTGIALNLTPGGRIAGLMFPVTAVLTVDGQTVPVDSGGNFGLPVVPGVHTVQAIAPNYTSYDNPDVDVSYGATTWLVIGLQGLAQLFGTVSPADANVTWSDLPVARTGAQYSVMVPAGSPVELTASARGFDPTTFGPYVLTLGERLQENLTLPPAPGWIVGTVSPNGSVLEVNGTQVLEQSLYGGLFNVSEPAGWYYVNLSAPGFEPASRVVTVVAGTSSWANVTLVATPPSLTGPGLTLISLAKGLVIDGALIGGLIAVFVVARRGRKVSPSVEGTAR